MMDNKNTLFIVSGMSGVGKTTIMRQIMTNEIVSFTTRPPRPNEIDSVDYNFVSHEQFQEWLNNDGLMEYSKYSDNYYGISRDEFESKIARDHAFAILDIHGLNQFKASYNKVVTIFLWAEYGEAWYRMKERGESDEFITKRLYTYMSEWNNRGRYDYVVWNRQDKLAETIDIVRSIIKSNI